MSQLGRNSSAAKAERRTRAEAAQTAWAELSPEKQLAMLDNRLGKNVGARKQRRRLTKAVLAQ